MSTCQHVNMSTCQHVNMSTCQHVNMGNFLMDFLGGCQHGYFLQIDIEDFEKMISGIFFGRSKNWGPTSESPKT
jgi:hypothetical protein